MCPKKPLSSLKKPCNLAIMNDDFLIGLEEFEVAGAARKSGMDDFLPDPALSDDDGEFSLQNGLLPAQAGGETTPTSLLAISPNKWDPRLLLDLVIAVDTLEVILDRYGLSREEYNALTTNIVFRRELANTMRDIRENGASFRAKARIQAESYLPVVDDMVWDRDLAASTRLDAVKSIVRWGDLEPKEKKEQVQQAAPQINVQILF